MRALEDELELFDLILSEARSVPAAFACRIRASVTSRVGCIERVVTVGYVVDHSRHDVRIGQRRWLVGAIANQFLTFSGHERRVLRRHRVRVVEVTGE